MLMNMKKIIFGWTSLFLATALTIRSNKWNEYHSTEPDFHLIGFGIIKSKTATQNTLPYTLLKKTYNRWSNKFLATCKASIGDGSGKCNALITGTGTGSGNGNGTGNGTGNGKGNGTGNGNSTGTGRIIFAFAPIAKHNKQATKIYYSI